MDHEEHSFVLDHFEAYAGFDADYDILGPGLTDLNEEQSKVTGMAV